MLSVTKQFTFDAAHKLPNHDGKCKNLHGHTYKIEVEFTGHIKKTGSSQGMIVDFGDLKKEINPLIEELDHSYLNENIDTPTAENLAIFISRYINMLPIPATLSRVRVWETPTSYAEWKPEPTPEMPVFGGI